VRRRTERLENPACHLLAGADRIRVALRREQGGLRAVNGLVESGAVRVVDLDDRALAWMVDFVERYSSVGAQLADAALMLIAEREGIDTVLTLDRRDFSVYRTGAGKALSIVPDA
jgi:predicted nucleic acid-binding protein